MWVSEFLRVFSGDATVETDKLDLVLPLLGLYGELLAREKKGSVLGSRGKQILGEIEAKKEVIFPRELRVEKGTLAKLNSDAKEASPLTEAMTLPLFGDLVARIEATVNEGEGDDCRELPELWRCTDRPERLAPQGKASAHGTHGPS